MNKLLRLTALILALTALLGCSPAAYETMYVEGGEKKVIKWVDYNVPLAAMKKALTIDVKSHTGDSVQKYNWIELLACLSAKNGNNFKSYRDSDLDKLVKRLEGGETLESITVGMKYYPYYLEAYTAVLGGFVGYYEEQEQDESGALVWKQKYGLKAFSPIAKGYSYSDYDDFGVARTYGYRRKHLGHDMMAAIGVPIVAVESGVIEELGWNQYGGWRVGIRSFDSKRYYYYAHMRKNHPYHKSLIKGQTVKAGDVIGYVGRTGYSLTENVNNVKDNHLHFGMQLIFDESQKEGNGEIWIDVYSIVQLLSQHRSKAVKNEETKDYSRVYDFREKADAYMQEATEAYLAEPTVELPVIMYHKVLKHSPIRGDNAVTPDELESDLKYLSNNGFHSVTINDLVAYVYNGIPLPGKPILITFDDGYYNNVYYAEPLLKKYGMRAILSVVGQFSDMSTERNETSPNYAYVTWPCVKKLVEDGVFEIQNHTYDLHKLSPTQGIKRKKAESLEAYQNRITKDIMKLQEKLKKETGYTPTAFTYPFGAFSDVSLDILLDMGFVSTLTCTEGMNEVIRGNPESLLQLKRYARKAGTSSEKYFAKILKAMKSSN